MSIDIEATYENGVLRPDQPLPFKERDRVRVTIRPTLSRMRRSAGMLRWRGDPQELRRIAEDDELGGLDSR